MDRPKKPDLDEQRIAPPEATQIEDSPETPRTTLESLLAEADMNSTGVHLINRTALAMVTSGGWGIRTLRIPGNGFMMRKIVNCFNSHDLEWMRETLAKLPEGEPLRLTTEATHAQIENPKGYATPINIQVVLIKKIEKNPDGTYTLVMDISTNPIIKATGEGTIEDREIRTPGIRQENVRLTIGPKTEDLGPLTSDQFNIALPPNVYSGPDRLRISMNSTNGKRFMQKLGAIGHRLKQNPVIKELAAPPAGVPRAAIEQFLSQMLTDLEPDEDAEQINERRTNMIKLIGALIESLNSQNLDIGVVQDATTEEIDIDSSQIDLTTVEGAQIIARQYEENEANGNPTILLLHDLSETEIPTEYAPQKLDIQSVTAQTTGGYEIQATLTDYELDENGVATGRMLEREGIKFTLPVTTHPLLDHTRALLFHPGTVLKPEHQRFPRLHDLADQADVSAYTKPVTEESSDGHIVIRLLEAGLNRWKTSQRNREFIGFMERRFEMLRTAIAMIETGGYEVVGLDKTSVPKNMDIVDINQGTSWLEDLIRLKKQAGDKPLRMVRDGVHSGNDQTIQVITIWEIQKNERTGHVHLVYDLMENPESIPGVGIRSEYAIIENALLENHHEFLKQGPFIVALPKTT